MEAHRVLENKLATWIGTDPQKVVVCSSGTAALHLAMEVLNPQKTVLLPNYTMIACARAVTLSDQNPMFLECGADLLLDPQSLRFAFTQMMDDYARTVMAVHVYGRRCNMEAVHKLVSTKRHSTYVIEDMAELHGAQPHSLTDAACWSFYKNKVVHCAEGEGGAVAFKTVQAADIARELRTLGGAKDYEHVPRGHNYRMSDLHARYILDSLSRVEAIMRERRRVERTYDELCPTAWRMPPRDCPWVYDLRIPCAGRDNLKIIVSRLRGKGVEARVGFLPMTQQEEYQYCHCFEGGSGPMSAKAADEMLYLPIDPGYDDITCKALMGELLKECREVLKIPTA